MTKTLQKAYMLCIMIDKYIATISNEDMENNIFYILFKNNDFDSGIVEQVINNIDKETDFFGYRIGQLLLSFSEVELNFIMSNKYTILEQVEINKNLSYARAIFSDLEAIKDIVFKTSLEDLMNPQETKYSIGRAQELFKSLYKAVNPIMAQWKKELKDIQEELPNE